MVTTVLRLSGILAVFATRMAAQGACTAIPTFTIKAVAGNGTPGFSDKGSVEFQQPGAVAVDGSGNIFVSDSVNDRVRQVSGFTLPDGGGTTTTIAGTGKSGIGFCDLRDTPAFSGNALDANLWVPAGLAILGSNVYVADFSNHCVRKLTGQSISVFAGNGGTVGVGANLGDNGLATDAALIPNGVAIDSASGVVYISDDNGRIRKVNTNGIISTVAGGGIGDPKLGGPATDVMLSPVGLALDPSRTALYIADRSPGIILKLDLASLTLTWVAGGGLSTGEGISAKSADLVPVGLTVDSSGCVYIADSGHCKIRMLDSSGNITTVAGSAQCADSGDSGPATSARLNSPYGVAADSAGNIFVADTGNNRIRVLQRNSAPPPPTCTYSAGPPLTNPEAPGAGSDTFSVTSPSACGWSASVSSASSWLTLINGAIGSGNGTVGFAFAANPGSSTRTGTITVSGTGAAPGAPVTVTVTQSGAPCGPTVAPQNTNENAAAGVDHFGVTAPVGCSWTANTTSDWLAVISGGSGTGSSQVPVNFSFAANPTSVPRTGTIKVTGSSDPNAPGQSAVTVTQAGTVCAGTITPTRSIFVPAAGSGGTLGLTFTATDCPWTAVSTAAWITVNSGATGVGNGTVQYTVAANNAVMPRIGTILVANQIFLVTEAGTAGMGAAGCTPTFSPAPPVSAPAGGGAGSFGITFPAGAACSWTAASNANWITVSSGITGSGNVGVNYALAANSASSPRSGAIIAGGHPFTINQAANAGSAGCTPSFSPASPLIVPAGGGGGSFQVNFTGGSACAWTASSNTSWLTVTSGLSGNGNSTIAYTAAANTVGKRSGAITVAGQSFTFNQTAASAGGTCPTFGPCPTISLIQSAGAFGASTTLSPGTWVEIYGSNLANAKQQWAATDFNGGAAPTSLGGVTITFNDQPAYVDYVSPGQVNVQVPSTLAPGPVQVVVNNSGEASAPYEVTLNPYQPGLLAPASFNISGKQYLVAILPDLSYALPSGAISGVASRPVLPGETVVIYAIGFGPVLGPTSTDVAAGQVAPDSSLVEAPVQFVFAGSPASVTYAGLVPGLVGLYQFDVVMPAVAAGSAVPVTVTLNGKAIGQTLYIAVGQGATPPTARTARR
jgi:uncharacterized protein (TIGR03437 family)